MSVLIKGMKMPEDCFSCPLKEEGFCNITNAYAVRINERNSDCPLVEIPETHGRLIDADELKDQYPHDSDWEYPVNTNEYVVQTINEAPTIIEAEGVEE